MPGDTLKLTSDIDCTNETISEIQIGKEHSASILNTIAIDGCGHTIKNITYNGAGEMIYNGSGNRALFEIKTRTLFKNVKFKNIVLGKYAMALWYIANTPWNDDNSETTESHRKEYGLYFENCYFGCVNCSERFGGDKYNESTRQYDSWGANSIFYCNHYTSTFYFTSCVFNIILATSNASAIYADGWTSGNINWGAKLKYCNIYLESTSNHRGYGYKENINDNDDKWLPDYILHKVYLVNSYLSGNVTINGDHNTGTGFLYIFQEFLYDDEIEKTFCLCNLKLQILAENGNETTLQNPLIQGYNYIIIPCNYDLFIVPDSLSSKKSDLFIDNFLLHENEKEGAISCTDAQLKNETYLKSIGMTDEWYIKPSVNDGYPWNDGIPTLQSFDPVIPVGESKVYIGSYKLSECYVGDKGISKIVFKDENIYQN